MAEGTGFTGMPPYPAYGMGPPTTAFPQATTASEPVASSSAPRWYAADYHHPLPANGTYVDVPGYAPGYATLSGLRRGATFGVAARGGGSCGGCGSGGRPQRGANQPDDAADRGQVRACDMPATCLRLAYTVSCVVSEGEKGRGGRGGQGGRRGTKAAGGCSATCVPQAQGPGHQGAAR